MKRLFFLSIVLLLTYNTYCQESESLIKQIAENYKKFEYKKVITLSESLITCGIQLPQSSLIEIFRLKALSHYSLGEEISTQICFISILEMRPDFKLDPLTHSPKIVNFFNTLKEKYIAQHRMSEIIPESEKADSLIFQPKEMSYISRPALLRSIIIPGWGHLYLKKKTKAFVFGGLAITTGILTLYYSIITHNKEQDYLYEINKEKIEDRYQTYNRAYKLRNILIPSYILIWLYVQSDLLLNEDHKINDKSTMISFYPTSHFKDQFLLNLLIQF